MNTSRWRFRFTNLERAYHSLIESQEALKKEPQNLFIRDSLIQRYEYTIELSWKTLKDYLFEEGFQDISTPKEVIRKAFQEGFIQDGEMWLTAIVDRNNTSHAYDESIAHRVVKDVDEKYSKLISDLFSFLKQQYEKK